MTIFRSNKGKKSERPGLPTEALILFLVFFLPGYFSPPGRDRMIDFGDPGFLVSYLAVTLPQIALLLLIISRKGENGFRRYHIGRPKPMDGAAALLLFGIIFLFSSLAARLLPGETHPVWLAGPGSMFPLAVAASFATGYREELFFRAYLLRELADFTGGKEAEPSWREITASSLLFSSGHLYQGPAGVVTIFIISQFLGFWFVRRKRFHEAALAHSLYNSAALFFLVIGEAL